MESSEIRITALDPDLIGSKDGSTTCKVERTSAGEGDPTQLLIPEILEQVFHHLPHANLKSCRLVSFLWNSEACRQLRRESVVYIRESEKSRLRSFARLLKQSSALIAGGLPLPFQLAILEVDLLQEESLLIILKDERLFPFRVTFQNFTSIWKSEASTKMLMRLLLLRGQYLQSIDISLEKEYDEEDANPTAETEEVPYSLLQLPELRRVRLLGGWRTSESREQLPALDLVTTRDSLNPISEFITKVINSSPKLNTFESSFSSEESLLQILSTANLGKLKSLLLSNLTPYLFKKLKTLTIPRLETLHALIDPNLIEQEFVASQLTHEVVENFSRSVEDLLISWNFNSIDDSFPHCPKLRSLSIMFWSGSLAAFNEASLPLLNAVRVHDSINEPGSGRLDPHFGVHTFGFECMKGTGVRYGLYSEEDFSDIVLYAQRQFPNITCLDLNLALTKKSLRMIISNFPSLEQLILDSENEYRESLFTGMEKKTLKAGLKKMGSDSADVDNNSRMPSFQDLKELKHLVLSRQYEYRFPSDVSMTNNGLLYGLSQLQKLNFLQLDWETGISPSAVQKSLSHLSKIVINYVDDLPKLDLLLSLEQNMPQVELNRNCSNIEHICSRMRRSTVR